jgi:hypothetical protein
VRYGPALLIGATAAAIALVLLLRSGETPPEPSAPGRRVAAPETAPTVSTDGAAPARAVDSSWTEARIRAEGARLRDQADDSHRVDDAQKIVEAIFRELPFPEALARLRLLAETAKPDGDVDRMTMLANLLGLALGRRLDDPTHVDLVAEAARASPAADARLMFVVALGSVPAASPAASAGLLRVVYDDPSRTVRQTALVNLGRLGLASDTLPVVRRYLARPPAGDEDAVEASNALGALENLANATPDSRGDARDLVREVLEWPSSEAADRVKLRALSTHAPWTAELRDAIEPLTRSANAALAAAASRALESPPR